MAGTVDTRSVFFPVALVPSSAFQRLAGSWSYEKLFRNGLLLGDTSVGLTGKFGTVYLMRDWTRWLRRPDETPLALKESVRSLYGIQAGERLDDFLKRTPGAAELWDHFFSEYSVLVKADGLDGHAPKAHAFGYVRTYNEVRLAFVMDWLGDDGTITLDRYVPARGLPTGVVAYVGVLICEALRRLHEIGRSHRDLKADNMFVCLSDAVDSEGRRIPTSIKLVDLGQSGSFEAESDHYQTSTMAYCGPEMFVPEQDPRYHMQNNASFDVWMIGAVLYFMRVGHDPRSKYRFGDPMYIEEKENGLQLPFAVMGEGHALDQKLDRVIRACTEAQPAYRPELIEVEAELIRIASGLGEEWPPLMDRVGLSDDMLVTLSVFFETYQNPTVGFSLDDIRVRLEKMSDEG